MFDSLISIDFFFRIGNKLANGDYLYIAPFALLIVIGVVGEFRRDRKK